MKLLKTTGNGRFEEIEWDKPEITNTQIEVKSIMTGVCRSDIDMMNGDFQTLPLSMQGHEGLGIVTKVGSGIFSTKVGDYVATRGEPAYADYYNCNMRDYVVVPELSPKYILEPVACGINIIAQPMMTHISHFSTDPSILIIGSGFLAWVAYNTLSCRLLQNVTVVGNHNQELWKSAGITLLSEIPDQTFDVIVDLSSRTDIFDYNIYKVNSLIIFGAQKKITTDFGNILWRSCVITFPSPRYIGFYKSLKLAEEYITNKYINVDHYWTKGYDRLTEWADAFKDGSERSIPNYNRGYLIWNHHYE
jgi:threonine dehydrogenase-like Zn-dependent dehydrogenase